MMILIKQVEPTISGKTYQCLSHLPFDLDMLPVLAWLQFYIQ